MRQLRLGLAAVCLACLIGGCDEGANPAPTAEQNSPNAGLNALDQMKKGGTGSTTSLDAAKSAKKDAANAK